METKEWKKHCKVNVDGRSYDGIAHVVQFQYDERFAPWFAAIQLADPGAMGIPRKIEVEFDNGRKAQCHIDSYHNDGIIAYFEGEMETPTVQLYVIGMSDLSTLSMMTGTRKHFFE